ncbi:MAG: hypothetical protein WAK61_08565 [Leclercia sp.]
MKRQLANMTIIELVRTAKNYANSIQQNETYSAIITEMGCRLEALNLAHIGAMNAVRSSTSTIDKLGAENAYLLNGAARDLSTSWMFHKTMLGAQAALVCVAQGDIRATRDWLEGTTDEAGAEIPDEITVPEVQAWFDSQMISNDGKSGFMARQQAEDAIRAECPATDTFLAKMHASAIPEGHTLVPQQMFLSAEAMEGICFHCGDGGFAFGEFTDGILFVGAIDDSDGQKIHGLHIATADYPGEGYATVCEFLPVTPQGAAQ